MRQKLVGLSYVTGPYLRSGLTSIPGLKTETNVLEAVAEGSWELERGKLASVTKALIVFGFQT